ncbi:MAG: metal-dependent hydrolase [Nitrospirales bacterium]|nr:MAG: metal-dependent hydrolase [Nitrospirales bacterium]
MQVTILGSGTNMHPTRAAAGYLFQTDGPILLDFGPRTLSNLLKTGVDRHTIQHLLFTHYHADHFSDFIPFFFDAVCHSKFARVRSDIIIYGPPGTKRLFGTIFRTFPNFSDTPFRVTLREVKDRPFVIGATRITPLPMTHSDQQVCLGYRLEYQGRAAAVSGDATVSSNLVRLCQDADLAVLDCSFSSHQPGSSHMHAEECGKVAEEANIKKLVLSHFYETADRSNVVAQARRFFSGPILKGKDLLTLQVGKGIAKTREQVRGSRSATHRQRVGSSD